jgi:large subunit ribosomal protein L29
MKAEELRLMSDEQLDLTAKEAAANLFHLRVQAQTERLDSPSELMKARRLIARIKTIQTERTRNASRAAAGVK